MQYVDSSALVKRYVREQDSDVAQRFLLADQDFVTAAVTLVEVRRALALRLGARDKDLGHAVEAFESDWRTMHVIALDDETCRRAADLATTTGARSLDALHLAAAHRAGAPAVRLVTFDVRLAQTARSLGWTVVGA